MEEVLKEDLALMLGKQNRDQLLKVVWAQKEETLIKKDLKVDLNLKEDPVMRREVKEDQDLINQVQMAGQVLREDLDLTENKELDLKVVHGQMEDQYWKADLMGDLRLKAGRYLKADQYWRVDQMEDLLSRVDLDLMEDQVLKADLDLMGDQRVDQNFDLDLRVDQDQMDDQHLKADLDLMVDLDLRVDQVYLEDLNMMADPDLKEDLLLMADQDLMLSKDLRAEQVWKEDQDKIKDLDLMVDHNLMPDSKADQQWDRKDHCHQDNNLKEDLNKELFLMESRDLIHIVVMRVEQHILSLKMRMVNVKQINQLLVTVIDNLMEDQMVIVLRQDQRQVNIERKEEMFIVGQKRKCKK